MASIRFTGMTSDIDTDSVIKTLLSIQQLKVDREVRSRQKYEWKQESITSATSALKEFRNTYTSLLSSANLMSASSFLTYKATASGTDSGAVTVKTDTSVSAGSFTINSVERLASASKAVSASGVSKSGELASSNSARLKDLDWATGLTFADGEISFSINGQAFTFTGDTTLGEMMNAVNSSDAGVTMSYSRLTDKITIATSETGADTSLTITNIKGNAFGAGGAFGIDPAADITAGQNAVLYVDGERIERSSNTFSADGVIYTLNYATDTPIRVTIEHDVDAVVDKIKSFVDAYNTLYSMLDEMVNTRKTVDERSYVPLTDEEKAEMTEEEIAAWEAIAKKGVLYGDTAMKQVLYDMRAAFYESVESAGISAADIGLRTTSDYTARGIIEIDEDMLRSAIEKDPEQVMKVFNSIADSDSTGAKANSQNGLMQRMYNICYNYEFNTGANSLESVEKQISSVKATIEKLETKMDEQAERYYLKFANMETLLAELQSQSDTISSWFSS